MTQNSGDLEQILEAVGLHSNETKVYLALLKLGQVGTTAIAEATNLHGQMVYRALDRLVDKAYVKKNTVNNRGQYSALSPKRILKDTQSKAAQLETVIKTLESLNVPALTDQISVFQGKEQFIAQELDNINQTQRHGEVVAIGGIDDMYWETMGSKMNEWDYIREQRCINARYVGSEQQRDFLKRSDDPNFEYRLLPHDFYGEVNIGVYPHAFAMYVFTEPVSSIYIYSPKIAQTYKSFFEALWKMGK